MNNDLISPKNEEGLRPSLTDSRETNDQMLDALNEEAMIDQEQQCCGTKDEYLYAFGIEEEEEEEE